MEDSERHVSDITPTGTAPGNGGEAPFTPDPRTTVSVLIVSHNCAEALVACLASLDDERASVPLDVIVVDNASQDGTVDLVSARFPWAQVVAKRENAGFARAANEAMRLAQGEYLLFLNPDTVLPPGTIAATVGELRRHEEVGMLGCKLVRPDGAFDHACKRGFPSIGSAFYYFVGLSRLMPDSPRFAQYTAGHLGRDETGFVDAVNGAFMLVRRAAADDVGPMDERYWLYAEDLDWCRRFWEKGWKILYWPGVEVVHVKGASAGDHRSPRLDFAFYRSIWLFYDKHHGAQHNRLVSAVVWLGVWTKFTLSVVFNALRSLLARGDRGSSRRSAGPGAD